MSDVASLDPLLITSPTVRCGTTLLQRLLCSSSNTLIYGEEIGKDLEMQLQIFASRQMVYHHSRARFDASLQQVLQGNTDDWLIDLMPNIDGYLQALRHGSFAGLNYCREHALSAGRSIWGFKYPSWSPYLLQLQQQIMPNTRVIYLVRDLHECVRSAKAWKVINTPADLQQFCMQWLQHVKFMREWPHKQNVLWLAYQQLTDKTDEVIRQLCEFLPFTGLDSKVLDKRINNIVHGTNTLIGTNDYLQPAALTTDEIQWVDKLLTDAGLVDLYAVMNQD
jgi:hypothetical protein